MAGILQIPNKRESEEITQIILKAASESITLEALKKVTAKPKKEQKQESGNYVKFTKKEIEQMPERLKRFFVIDEKVVNYRITQNGLYQRGGVRIEVASKEFTTMKKKFLAKFLEYEKRREQMGYPLFKDYAAEWLKEKARTVKESTYKGYEQIVRANLLPVFGEMSLNQLNRKNIQDFLYPWK